MIEVIAIIVLGVVCVAHTVASILRERSSRKPIEWPMAQAIAKSLITTYQRGKVDGAHEPTDQGDEWAGFETPLKDDIPYDPAQEAADRGDTDPADVIGVTTAPLEA